jgi:hypothetical protein
LTIMLTIKDIVLCNLVPGFIFSPAYICDVNYLVNGFNLVLLALDREERCRQVSLVSWAFT